MMRRINGLYVNSDWEFDTQRGFFQIIEVLFKMGVGYIVVGHIPVEELDKGVSVETMDEKKLGGLVDKYLDNEWSVLKKSENQKNSKCCDPGGYDDPPYDDEFRPHWGPGSKYKPWIYG